MSFFDAFTGDAQKDQLQAAQEEADRFLRQGYKKQNKYYDQAAGLYQPYADQGRAGGDFYYNALGLGGDDARAAALNTLTSNPLFQGQLAQESNAMARLLNARGASSGGRAQLAAQRVFQENAGNWLDRYRALGDRGYDATGNIARIRTGQGDNAYGYQATRAGNRINLGNALAAAEGIGVNNLFNALGLGVKAIGAVNGVPVE